MNPNKLPDHYITPISRVYSYPNDGASFSQQSEAYYQPCSSSIPNLAVPPPPINKSMFTVPPPTPLSWKPAQSSNNISSHGSLPSHSSYAGEMLQPLSTAVLPPVNYSVPPPPMCTKPLRSSLSGYNNYENHNSSHLNNNSSQLNGKDSYPGIYDLPSLSSHGPEAGDYHERIKSYTSHRNEDYPNTGLYKERRTPEMNYRRRNGADYEISKEPRIYEGRKRRSCSPYPLTRSPKYHRTSQNRQKAVSPIRHIPRQFSQRSPARSPARSPTHRSPSISHSKRPFARERMGNLQSMSSRRSPSRRSTKSLSRKSPYKKSPSRPLSRRSPSRPSSREKRSVSYRSPSETSHSTSRKYLSKKSSPRRSLSPAAAPLSKSKIHTSRYAAKPVQRSAERSPSPRFCAISDEKLLHSRLYQLKIDQERVNFKLPKQHSMIVDATFIEEQSETEEEAQKLQSFEEVRAAWVRSAPADLYYCRDEKNLQVMKATQKLMNLCNTFEETLIKRADRAREKIARKKIGTINKDAFKTGTDCHKFDVSKVKPSINQDKVSEREKGDSMSTPPQTDSKENTPTHKHDTHSYDRKCKQRDLKCMSQASKSGEKRKKNVSKIRKGKKVCVSDCSSSDSGRSRKNSSSTSSSSEDEAEWALKGAEEMERKKKHPERLHPELWFNDEGEMNDGPLCRCSLRARRSGIRHGYYAGEEPLSSCDLWSNNASRLHHYLVTISPPTNFLVKTPTTIMYDNHEFIFEGFSLLSHHPLEEVPICQVIRFNIEYSIYYVEEKMPENFCIKELNLFYDYLFKEILELVDLNFKAIGDEDGCPRFHFLPRFVRQLPDNGKEVLSMNEVLHYLMKSSVPLVQEEELAKLIHFSEHDWLNYTDQIKGMIVTYPGKKPCSIRVDQLDRDQLYEETINYPVIVHFGIRPPQLSYAGNPAYQKALREYVKFRHLLANMPKPSFEDKRQLETKENRLQEMRMASKMKRDVTVAISAQGFYRTGIMCDIVQHALLIPVLVRHLRFHRSLSSLETEISYKFKTRLLLQLALTHPSYRENFGTNPDHARNSLTNCGVRQPQYGDRRIHFMNTHKRGINTLVNIMSRFGKNEESESKITHNERLEFLGDAVVEFLTSIHLFHLFPTLEEGGLATYRAAVVQNQHLSVLADKLSLDQFVLHAHGSDLCHTFELRHAMANCFEALMGAIFIDSNIEAADGVFSVTLFKGEDELLNIWVNYKPHPLQEQEPSGDRRWIETFPILQKLAKFEESIGVEFRHIRLLARAFTDRSIGFNYLTLGSNQRLEFLGDTVLQLVASEYLYRFFPEHHEGHLSLLRSSLVNNRTQAVVCDDLQMTQYAMYSNLKTELKTKDRADLLESFLGAMYIDRGLDYCRVFCLVCFFPRLQQFIINQEWNDPKSKLQQCCLTLRTMEGGEPDIPVYKVIECKGPTNTRVYTVAVYFKDKRLAKASGHSIQQAEMNSAKEALLNNKKLFPQLAYQRRVIEKNIKSQGVDPPSLEARRKSDWRNIEKREHRNNSAKRREERGRGESSNREDRGKGEWRGEREWKRREDGKEIEGRGRGNGRRVEETSKGERNKRDEDKSEREKSREENEEYKIYS